MRKWENERMREWKDERMREWEDEKMRGELMRIETIIMYKWINVREREMFI